MSELVLVTGGCRSGKSDHAQVLAESLGGSRLFIATATAGDEEMARRIAAHREARAGRGWATVEEPIALGEALGRAGAEVVLVDCLTLWMSNLMAAAAERGAGLTRSEVEGACLGMLRAARGRGGTVLFVTNEVGMGIVPANEVAREFRDHVGLCNRLVAREADRVLFMVSGIPLVLKSAK